MKIVTVTYLDNNYGSILQAFALQKKLKEFGADPVIVQKVGQKPKGLKLLRSRLHFLKPRKNYTLCMRFKVENMSYKYSEKMKKLNQFIANNISCTSVLSEDEIINKLRKSDILLAGSDQVWSMMNGILSDWYTFQWRNLPSDIPRVSYAASIGMAEVDEKRLCEYQKKLSTFSIVSFREKCAKAAIENVLKCDVRCDLDPTLLYDEDFWGKIASPQLVKEPYVFVYMLRPDIKLIKMARTVAKKKNCKVIYTGLLPDRFKGVNTVYDAGVEDFLSYIRFCEMVITNSFHGTAFSILFQKNFVNVRIASTSSRVENLLEIVKLEDRIISDITQLGKLEEPINYEAVLKRLSVEKEKSSKYLEDLCCGSILKSYK